MKYAAFNEIHSHEISFEGFGTCIHQSAVSRFVTKLEGGQ